MCGSLCKNEWYEDVAAATLDSSSRLMSYCFMAAIKYSVGIQLLALAGRPASACRPTAWHITLRTHLASPKVYIPPEFLVLSGLTNLSQTAIPGVKARRCPKESGLLHFTMLAFSKLWSVFQNSGPIFKGKGRLFLLVLENLFCTSWKAWTFMTGIKS